MANPSAVTPRRVLADRLDPAGAREREAGEGEVGRRAEPVVGVVGFVDVGFAAVPLALDGVPHAGGPLEVADEVGALVGSSE